MSLSPPSKIAFLGAGLMGQPMVVRLLNAGHGPTVWNRTRSKTDRLLALGAQVAATPADAVSDSDIVITMLEAGPVVENVIASSLPRLRPGTLVIDMSSTRQSGGIL